MLNVELSASVASPVDGSPSGAIERPGSDGDRGGCREEGGLVDATGGLCEEAGAEESDEAVEEVAAKSPVDVVVAHDWTLAYSSRLAVDGGCWDSTLLVALHSKLALTSSCDAVG